MCIPHICCSFKMYLYSGQLASVSLLLPCRSSPAFSWTTTIVPELISSLTFSADPFQLIFCVTFRIIKQSKAKQNNKKQQRHGLSQVGGLLRVFLWLPFDLKTLCYISLNISYPSSWVTLPHPCHYFPALLPNNSHYVCVTFIIFHFLI